MQDIDLCLHLFTICSPQFHQCIFRSLIVFYDFFLLLINVLVNIICILGEALPVVNVTQLEKDTIVNKCTGQYYLYFR